MRTQNSTLYRFATDCSSGGSGGGNMNPKENSRGDAGSSLHSQIPVSDDALAALDLLLVVAGTKRKSRCRAKQILSSLQQTPFEVFSADMPLGLTQISPLRLKVLQVKTFRMLRSGDEA